MFSFIILHYNNIEDTIKCLDKINSIKNDNTNIIVVDNHTLSDIEKKLIKKFTKDILILDKNYGFAKANNKGILYAKKKYNSKYYIVINNDVFIDQKDFLNIIDEDYKKYKFDMLGPKISSPSKESVNPFPVIKTKEQIEKEINKANKLIKIYKSSILYFLLNVYLKLKYLFKKIERPVNGSKLEKKVALHGCALIFSNEYIKKYDYPLYNNTYLFHEEEFLYKRVVDDNLVSIYDPNLCVFHKEGSSLKKNIKSERLSKLFKEKERIKSLELLLKEWGK